jgi:16S rRNA (cytosine1402-N4)-methyltransferase
MGWAMRSLSTSLVEDPRSAPFHLRQPGTHPGGSHFVERLRMASHDHDPLAAFSHEPVMLEQAVEQLSGAPDGIYIDTTLGRGGHARAVLDANPGYSLLGIDRDSEAIAAATQNLESHKNRLRLRQGTYDQLGEFAAEEFPGQPVTAVLMDLGVSSHQIDTPDRGFSYRNDGPLDMRMDRTAPLDAGEVVNSYSQEALVRVLLDGGEDRFAPRIAKAIVANRPFQTTAELAEVVRNATPGAARKRGGDPAKRTFQAVRIEVNDELRILRSALGAALDVISNQGRLVVLSYHSGEDRMVKQLLTDVVTGGCVCPSNLPCVCGATPGARWIGRGSKMPSNAEVSNNSRAQSVRLRAVELIKNENHTGESRK